MGCFWPWRLLGGATCYCPVSCFSHTSLLPLSNALSLYWQRLQYHYSIKGPEKLEISQQSSQILSSLQQGWRADQVPPCRFFSREISLSEKARVGEEEQVGKLRKMTDISFHMFALSLGRGWDGQVGLANSDPLPNTTDSQVTLLGWRGYHRFYIDLRPLVLWHQHQMLSFPGSLPLSSLLEEILYS